MSGAAFGGLPVVAAGRLSIVAFAANAGGVAQDVQDRILFDTATGRVLYGPDGSGSAKAVAFARLLSVATLWASDFAVIEAVTTPRCRAG